MHKLLGKINNPFSASLCKAQWNKYQKNMTSADNNGGGTNFEPLVFFRENAPVMCDYVQYHSAVVCSLKLLFGICLSTCERQRGVEYQNSP